MAKKRKVRMQSGTINCRAYCLKCGYGPMDGATGMEFSDAEEPLRTEPIMPHDGAISICAKCGNIAVYQQTEKGLTLRPPEQKHIDYVMEHEELRAIWERFRGSSGIQN